MTRIVSVSEFRDRRKPFEHTTRAGETFILRLVSLTSLISAGTLPSDLMRIAIALSGGNTTEREILSHPQEYTRLIEQILIRGSVEPKIGENEDDEKSLSINEIDDQTKIELFSVLLQSSLRLFGKEEVQEIDLAPFSEESGSAPGSADGKILESEAVENNRNPIKSSEGT